MSDTLTPVERQVVRCTLGRFTPQQIARTLNMSERAVQENLRTIYRKLGITTPLELLLCVYSGGVKIGEEKSAAA